MSSLPPPLLTVRQVADTLQVSPATIQRWARTGQIPHRRVGKQVRIHPDELEDWMRPGASARIPNPYYQPIGKP